MTTTPSSLDVASSFVSELQDLVAQNRVLVDILRRFHNGDLVTHAEVCNVLDRYETENA